MTPNALAHFAIHADDCARAKRFYEQVFAWRFEAWGPPGFWLIRPGGNGGVAGSLQERREPLTGTGMRGFECTIGVADIKATAQAVAEAGGTLTIPPYTIERVGVMIQFLDTEGNVVNAMQYEPGTIQ